MTLTLNTHIYSLNQLVLSHRLQWFQKHPILIFFLQKANVTKFDLAIGQGHSRVIIRTNYNGQESQILHSKFVEIGPLVLE